MVIVKCCLCIPIYISMYFYLFIICLPVYLLRERDKEGERERLWSVQANLYRIHLLRKTSSYYSFLIKDLLVLQSGEHLIASTIYTLQNTVNGYEIACIWNSNTMYIIYDPKKCWFYISNTFCFCFLLTLNCENRVKQLLPLAMF